MGKNGKTKQMWQKCYTPFFTEIGPNHSRHVMEVDNSFEKFLSETDEDFMFKETTSTHIFSLLSKLFRSKTTGLDNISAKLLRKCPDLLAQSLTVLFNQSLITGIFPNGRKSASVTPLDKTPGSVLSRQITEQYQ